MKKIFYNGDFVTLEKENIEAILIEDKIIKIVGSKEEVFKDADEKAEIIDLHGHTMMPAFLDAHSHFTSVANNLLKVNLEECVSFAEINQKLLNFKKNNNVKDGEWIIACNYDHNNLVEKRIQPKI